MTRTPSRAVGLALLLAAGLLAAPVTGQQVRPLTTTGGGLERLALEAFGGRAARAVQLGLPPEAGPRLVVPSPFAEAPGPLVLERSSRRAPGFTVLAWLADGTFQELPVGPPRTYRGALGDGTVLARLEPLGLAADWHRADGSVVRLRPLAPLGAGHGPGDHVVLHGPASEALPLPACGADHPTAAATLAAGPTPGADLRVDGLGGQAGPTGPGPGPCLQRAAIAFDADFEYFSAQGSSVPETVATIEGHLDQVDFFYARDMGLTYELTQVVVRTAPFYAPTGGGDLLDQFRAEWNSTLAAVPRDLAHLMTGKPGSLIEFGGLAWVGVVCNTGLAYGWSMDSAGIIGHEVGHNWGSSHCHDSAPCNNMCGACLYVGPNTKAVKQAYIAGLACLEPVAFPPAPLPPYVLPETLSLRKDAYASLQPALLDVLANDEDNDCQQPFVAALDGASEQGAGLSVTALPGGGEGLRYDAPADLFVGSDRFAYTVGGGSGPTADGQVTVTVRPLLLTGRWGLDEGAGSLAADDGPAGLDATLVGGAWTAGPFGGAVQLDGVDDELLLPPLDLPGDALTLAGWFRRDGQQALNAGLVFCREGGTQSGLFLGANQDLRYAWANQFGSLLWSPGLVMPDGQWVLVVLTVEPDRATLWLGDDTTLQSATNTLVHLPQTFDGTTRVGNDPLAPGRFFAGAVDELRVWDHALSAEAVDALWRAGGRAELPLPADGGLLPDAAGTLRWGNLLPADDATVYLGAGYEAVRDAGPGSPLELGTVAQASVAVAGLTHGERRYWRVDRRVGGQTVPGDVWQFRVADTGHWTLDELAGTTAADSHLGAPGSYSGGVLLDKEPATPFTGRSIRLQGVDEGVVLPPLDLHSDTVTITAWVRRIGDQDDWAGLVFTRDGGSVAGLNVGTDNELRYHWNGSGDTWGWDSGLVLPEATWAFCALVVEPHQATIHMAVEDGPLQSAVNPVGHAPEEWDGQAWLGRDPTGGPRWFNGRLDDVRVFDVALSPAAVAQLHRDAVEGP